MTLYVVALLLEALIWIDCVKLVITVSLSYYSSIVSFTPITYLEMRMISSTTNLHNKLSLLTNVAN